MHMLLLGSLAVSGLGFVIFYIAGFSLSNAAIGIASVLCAHVFLAACCSQVAFSILLFVHGIWVGFSTMHVVSFVTAAFSVVCFYGLSYMWGL
jgi:hypothetical protein